MDTLSGGGQPPGPHAAGGEAAPSQRRAPGKRPVRERHRRSALHRGENLFGWLFISPSLAVLLLFLVAPIILALYISFTNWSGVTSPTSSAVKWVGLHNYRTILTKPGLYQSNFGAAIRNNFYFVIFTVPLQTIFALWLAVLVNNKFLRGRGFPDCLLFPVDHQLHRHHHDLHLPGPGRRRRQHGPRLGRHQGAELAL